MKNNEEPLPQKIRKEEENRQVFKTFKIPPKSIGGTAERQEKEKIRMVIGNSVIFHWKMHQEIMDFRIASFS